MDGQARVWYFSDMKSDRSPIKTYALFGEERRFPDLLHIESINDRAAGLNWTIAPHRHLELHQFLVLHEGDGRVTLDGQVGRLVPPMLVNLPPGTVHSFQFSAGAAGLVITLPTSEWRDFFGAADGLGVAFCIEAVRSIMVAADLLAQASRDRDDLRHLRLRVAVSTLFLSIVERPHPADPKGRAGDKRLERLHALIDSAPNIRLSAIDCAQTLGLSPRHLSRLCQAETGLPLQALLHAAVVREACRLLAYTMLSVASVGHRLGFDDPSYFSRFFRRQAGVSPLGYRARYNGLPPG